MKTSYNIAHAAGWDAGNRSMRKAGREKWNEEDWQIASETFNKILKEDDNGQD